MTKREAYKRFRCEHCVFFDRESDACLCLEPESDDCLKAWKMQNWIRRMQKDAKEKEYLKKIQLMEEEEFAEKLEKCMQFASKVFDIPAGSLKELICFKEKKYAVLCYDVDMKMVSNLPVFDSKEEAVAYLKEDATECLQYGLKAARRAPQFSKR